MGSVSDRDFCVVATKLYKPRVRVDRNVDLRMALLERIEPLYQKFARKGWLDADPQGALSRLADDFRQPTVDVVKAGGQLTEERLPRFRQFDSAVKPLEEWPADQDFQFPYLSADRRL